MKIITKQYASFSRTHPLSLSLYCLLLFKPSHKPSPKPSHYPTASPFGGEVEEEVEEEDEDEDKTSLPTMKPSKKPTKSPTMMPTHTANPDLTFTLTRSGYIPLIYFSNPSSILQYKSLSGHTAVVEPFAPMSLFILSDTVDNSSDDDYYVFSLCSAGSTDSNDCEEGRYDKENDDNIDATFECLVNDVIDLTVTKYDKDDAVLAVAFGTALCIYVRREIRGLTASDLRATMDAMYSMWSMSDEEGQDSYGENFHSSKYFTEAHHFNAAWQDGDHIHEGLGFLPQHFKITNIFEASMQAVDPSISLPYWDFTIESEDGSTIFDSFMFTPETFGTLSVPKNEYYWSYEEDSLSDGKIPDGRWAGIKTEYNTRFDELVNAYGYLRGPWNMNPSTYVTRFPIDLSIPGCGAYYEWAEESTLKDFLKASPYLPHATLHSSIGGVFGCDTFDSWLESGMIIDLDSQITMCSKWGFYLKVRLNNSYYIDVSIFLNF